MSGINIIPYIIDNKFAIDIDEINSFNSAKEIIADYPCIKYDE